jgi:hypothetical protein
MSPMPDEGHAANDFRTAWWQRLAKEGATYELARFSILRLLALVQLAAFVSLAWQLDSLIGSDGLLPAAQWLDSVRAGLGFEAYWRVPTLFWLSASDGAMHVACAAGIALSAAALLGVTHAGVELAIWALYASFVHVGQIFYGYGWELQLLETTVLASFLCPWRGWRPLPRTRSPVVVLWLFRWLVFRVMLGSALIKLRGDPCWLDFTCLDFHFETQPNPNPLSYWLHAAPHGVHVAGVVFTYAVELLVPWFAFPFAFRRARLWAGVGLVALQVMLIASGNLSFLNWLTIVPALACFDDDVLARFLPRGLRRAWRARLAALRPPSLGQARGAGAWAVVVAILSVAPVANLASCDQRMNASFDPLDLVNTYGAFGSVDRARYEVILEGSQAPALGPATAWTEFELPCAPGTPTRHPCVVTPYHYRLDWQMWFVGNAAPRGERIAQEPWLVHLIWQLLRGEPQATRLLARPPFAEGPPRWIRAGIWRYEFSRAPGPAWWSRERVGELLPPVSVDDPGLRAFVRAYRWPDAPSDE